MPTISRGQILKWIKAVNRYNTKVKIGWITLTQEEAYELMMLALRGLDNKA